MLNKILRYELPDCHEDRLTLFCLLGLSLLFLAYIFCLWYWLHAFMNSSPLETKDVVIAFGTLKVQKQVFKRLRFKK